MTARGIEHFIYTDISRDGTMEHPDFDAFARVLSEAAVDAHEGEHAPIVFGGGIAAIEDIERLANEFDIEGVIIGRALYDGRIDLRAAQRMLETGDDW